MPSVWNDHSLKMIYEVCSIGYNILIEFTTESFSSNLVLNDWEAK